MIIFGNPLFLYALSAVTIPVIIHLVHSRRAKVKPFSTLRFLHFSLKKRARKLKLNNILLLLLRMGIIAFLCLALAEPVMKVSKFPLIGGNTPSSVVVIIDNSYSMGYREEGISLFDKAKEAGIDILDTLNESDEVTIILMNEDADMVFKEFSHDITLAKSELSGASLSHKATDVRKSLRKAYELLEKSKKANKEIYLLSDLQENSWQSAVGAASRRPNKAGEVNSPLQASDQRYDNLDIEISEEVAVFIVPFGHPNPENVFIESVDFPAYGHVAGLPIEFTTKVVNLSSQPVSEMVTLTIDGVKRVKLPVLLSVGPETVKMTYTFEKPGAYSGEISIKGDKLTEDDGYQFKVWIEDKIPVLCVDGDPSRVSALSESFYLMTALSPAFGASAIAPDSVELSRLDSKNLFKYRVVMLCNVPHLGGADLINIEQYLKAGGNLIIFLGSKVKPADYNRWEFLPSSILSPEGYPNKENSFNLGLIDYTHPIFRKFSLPANGDLSVPKFYQCYSMKEGSQYKVLARFSNGFPAFIEHSYGPGKVILVTSTADSDWTNLPLRAVYPPLIHQMIHYLSRKEPEKKYVVGDSVSFQSSLSGDRRITITNPDGTKFDLIPSPEEDDATAIFHETTIPGIYSVSGAGFPGEKKEFAVNLNTFESILSRIAPEKINEVFPEDSLTIVNNPEKLSLLIRRSRQGVELWGKLLLLTLLFFIAELFLANRLSYQRRVKP